MSVIFDPQFSLGLLACGTLAMFVVLILTGVFCLAAEIIGFLLDL